MSTPAHDVALHNIVLIVAKAVSEAVAAEREACARIAEERIESSGRFNALMNVATHIADECSAIAAAIRARKVHG